MLSQLASRRVSTRQVAARGLKENVAALPSTDGVKAVRIPQLQWEIKPQPGKMASVAIYSYLAQAYGGQLNSAAADKGLALYDEVVADAVARPGAHPNIDLLFKVKSEGLSVDIVVDK
mmetsp:Transcript_32374/g.82211  ORF Transcript_32374/g.82211 Transcript_32374/m.82211 type:complete len:118 (-) Transcript_32374:290-643(-)|eukprot:CAMPEP_0202876754 /NCGR_PEP_ID=MMETSP1391-20130828/29561_1 /ASSEMBLY_ACC=CAM_ASM_000867 /TAXON_ID=1034604 /ORGANISM="Chlamydomonas leiostraca, Strain SAG 11-49" /LENGTH=117 /DNA_ID=CAMNT_0049558667 /DNA_START=118 /DNA_END=471 /DNA_ORIENTATION=+